MMTVDTNLKKITILEDMLENAPRCDSNHDNLKPDGCSNPAEWFIKFEPSCEHDCRLICTERKDMALADNVTYEGRFYCTACSMDKKFASINPWG